MTVNGSGVPGAVVLGSDFRGLAAVRALGRRGIPSVVVDGDPRSAWFSRYVVGRERWSGPMHGEAFRDFLIDLAARRRLQGWVLIPLLDEAVEVVSRDAEILGSSYRLTTPPWEVARWALDKRLTNELARATGVPHPQTWYPSGPEDLDRLPVTFPAVVKPTMSTWLQHSLRRKALWAHDARELLESYLLLAGLVPPEGIVIQEAIPGDGRSQVSAALFCKDGAVLGAMTARRLRQYPIDFGLSSCYVEAIPIPGLIDLARPLMREMGFTGVAEVEFKRDERQDTYKLLDINIRLWGWHALCVPCGLDFTHLLYRQAVGDQVAPGEPVYGWRWRRMLTDLPAAAQEIRAGITTPGGYLRSFVRGRTVASVFDPLDPAPAFGDLAVAVKRRGAHWLSSRRRRAHDSVEAAPAHGHPAGGETSTRRSA